MLRRWLVVSAVVATAAMLYAAPAGASRAPNRTERQGITNAVHAATKVPQNRYTVTGQRVSTVSRYWAMAKLVATSAFRSSFQNGVAVLIRIPGTNRWVEIEEGSSMVGCGVAPNKVLADLFRTNRPCVGGIS